MDEALQSGAALYTHVKIKKILHDGRSVQGVEGTIGGKKFIAHAPYVVVAAGGIGSPRLLQASGFKDAGKGMTMDVTVMVYGTISDKGIGKEPPMTWSWENDADGYMLSTLIDPWLLYPLAAMTTLKMELPDEPPLKSLSMVNVMSALPARVLRECVPVPVLVMSMAAPPLVAASLKVVTLEVVLYEASRM